MASTPVVAGEGLHGTHHRSGKRVRQLLHPSGRRIHIAADPEEHERLKLRLTTSEPDEKFEVCVHGSEEHLAAVREIHAHTEQQRVELRRKHTQVYEDFENVHRQLDLLSSELHRLTEHGVSLDANFSKYGYDAHLRTKEPESSASSTSLGHSSEHEPRDWDAERHKGMALTLWKKPIIRQYFHRGLLWRAQVNEEVASFELFVDLLYVGIIAIIGDAAAENATRFGLLQFIITFTLGWKMWNDLTVIISWFETDDICQRLSVLFVMMCLFGYTLNIVHAFNTTWVQLISFYLAQRLFSGVYLVSVGFILPMVRGAMIFYGIMGLIPSILWIGSVHLNYPNRLALVWIAIPLDLFGPLLLILFRRIPGRRLNAKMAEWFDFYPAMNIEHRTERTNAFVTLVLGYSVVSLLYQNKAPFALNAFFGKAVLGLIQAFSFNWIYFEVDGFNLHTHAIRRHVVSSMIWSTFHLPFIMSFVLAGASLSRLVLAHDCADTDRETLDESYIVRSESEVSMGLRWFYCAGLGIALACMTVISLCHVHKKVENQQIMKRPRLAVRAVVALVLICLPLAEGLSSLRLISTTTGLIVLTLMVEVWGQTPKATSFWKGRRNCKYSAECRVKRKMIDDALKAGVMIDVAELSKSEGETSESGRFEAV